MNYVNVLAASAALAFGISTAQATAINYQASGSLTDGSPLFGIADFTTGAGFIDVTLINGLTASTFQNQGQTLSDITFVLSNPPGKQGTLSVVSGQLGDIDPSTGVVTYLSTGSPVRFLGQGPHAPNGSGTFTVSGSTITMEALGGGAPSELIVPLVSDGGKFTSNLSNVSNFNPYTIGPAMFELDFAGVTAQTTITSAIFSFGTNPDKSLPGSTCVDCGPGTLSNGVPEPASMLVLGAGLVGLGAARRWGRQQASTI